MSESDLVAIETAVELNPIAIAEAEGYVKKGLMILSREMGLNIAGQLVAGILAQLECDLPDRRLH